MNIGLFINICGSYTYQFDIFYSGYVMYYSFASIIAIYDENIIILKFFKSFYDLFYYFLIFYKIV